MSEIMWKFETAKFEVVAMITPDDDADISWVDDQDRAKIESGDYQVFGTIVRVFCDGIKIGEDSLWGSVYSDPREFFTAHRDADPMNRNCSIMRAARGSNACTCHYFPDMVRAAVHNAHRTRCRLPHTRIDQSRRTDIGR